jgi:O-antigen ligase
MENKASLLIVFLLEILAVLLAVFGVLPREIVLISTGIMVFYFIFAKTEDSLILFIASIPIFVALPITDAFDGMANWRILLVVLFLVWFFKKRYLQTIFSKGLCCLPPFKINFNLTKYVLLFLFIGFLSLFVATSPVAGIKKLLFLINIFLLFPIVRDVVKNEKQKARINKIGTVVVVIVLLVGFSQAISGFFTSLYNFWQWWANHVITVFYGNNLSELLKVSNTWFAYYPDSPPTLRMFSLFPDSHSFAMFLIIGMTFLIYRFRPQNRFKNLGIWAIVVFSFLALISSGSRGVWLSAVIPFLIAMFLLVFKKEKIFKPFILMLIIFALSFPVSSLLLSNSRQDGEDATLAFKRAKSIADLDDLSVKSRLGIWKASAQSILKHPLLGVGIGNYPVVLGENISAAKKGASAHNLYLDIASETGLLGLIAFMLIILEILFYAVKRIKSQEFVLVFLFFFAWILLYNLFDVVLFNDKVLLLFMVVLALTYQNKEFDIKKQEI